MASRDKSAFEFVEPIKLVEPRKPAPTYTFWRKPNDTFPMGSIVYFMYSGGRVKIGYSAGLLSRHTTLKTAGPFPPVVLLIVAGTPDTEKQFHGRFEADRLHGEWFSLSKGMRNFFGSGSDELWSGHFGNVVKWHGNAWADVRMDKPKRGWPNPVVICGNHLRIPA